MYTNGQIDFENITDYDKYMLKKSGSVSFYGVDSKSKSKNVKSGKVLYRQPKNANRQPESISRDSNVRPMDYRAYLLTQLDRTEAAYILTEEEFYAQQKALRAGKEEGEEKVKYAYVRENGFYDSLKRNVKNFFNKKAVTAKNLKLGSKIFIASYVLIVIAVASTILVVNAKKTVVPNDSLILADNTQYEEVTDEVQPMTLEENETESQNWFDKLLDALKK